MALYALEDVGDAIAATERFLRPVDRVRWLRLAVVMFFVTSGGLSFQFPSLPGDGGGFDAGDGVDPGSGPAPDPGTAPPDITPELTTALVTLVVAVVALVVVLALGYLFVAAVMEFVFVESLRTEDVRLWGYARTNLWRGARLFAFRLLVWFLTASAIAAVALALGAAVGGWPPTRWGVAAVLAALLGALPLVFLAAVVVGNLLGFTTVFVVPIMLCEDRGVLSAWRRFWPALVAQWPQFLVYAVVGFLLGVGVGIATGIVVAVLALVLALPFVIVGALVFFTVGVGGVGGAVLLVLVLLYALAVLVVALVVQVPFQTFLRYYALFVLGDADDDFDVIPDARAAVRADGGRDRGSDEASDDADSATVAVDDGDESSDAGDSDESGDSEGRRG